MASTSTKASDDAKRVYFTRDKNVIDLPSLVDHQNKSFQWFVDEGLGELLAEISPIDDYTGSKLSLRFKDYHFGDPKMTEAEARENNVSSTASVPGAPTNATATAGDGQALVSWNAPANNGGATITGYTVTCSPGNLTATTSGDTTAVVTGLTNGTAYTFTITATNSAGTGPASSPSNSVTPAAPSNILYGPDGTEWPANTVSDGTNFDVTVSSLSVHEPHLLPGSTATGFGAYHYTPGRAEAEPRLRNTPCTGSATLGEAVWL